MDHPEYEDISRQLGRFWMRSRDDSLSLAERQRADAVLRAVRAFLDLAASSGGQEGR